MRGTHVCTVYLSGYNIYDIHKKTQLPFKEIWKLTHITLKNGLWVSSCPLFRYPLRYDNMKVLRIITKAVVMTKILLAES
jgi:hypothetical protein